MRLLTEGLDSRSFEVATFIKNLKIFLDSLMLFGDRCDRFILDYGLSSKFKEILSPSSGREE